MEVEYVWGGSEVLTFFILMGDSKVQWRLRTSFERWLHTIGILYRNTLLNRYVHFINVDKLRAAGGELVWLEELLQTPSNDGERHEGFCLFVCLFVLMKPIWPLNHLIFLILCPRHIFASIFSKLCRRTLYCYSGMSFKYCRSSKLRVTFLF